jgi:hypothetical protein
MAATVTSLDARFTDKVFRQTAGTATGDFNVTGGGGTLYAIDINNASSEIACMKVYDAKSATNATAAILAFTVPVGGRRQMFIPDGLAFTNGLCIRCTDQDVNDAASPGSDGATPSGSAVGIVVVVS